MRWVNLTYIVIALLQIGLKVACWTIRAMAIAMMFVSQVFAAVHSNQMVNTATISVATNATDPDQTNNSSTAVLDKQSRVIVRKTAIGGNDVFEFTSSFPELNVEVATYENKGDSGYQAVDIGTHTLAETPKAGWSLRSVECVDPDGGTEVDEVSNEVQLDVDAFEDIDCEFTNQKNSTFTLKKETIDGDGTFEFETSLINKDGSISTAEITTSNEAGTLVFSDILPGVHNINEIQQDGWDLVDIKCDLENNDGLILPTDLDEDGVLDTTNFEFELASSETASCTFINRKALPTLNVSQHLIEQPKFIGGDLYTAKLQISVLNTGNTAILLDRIENNLVDSFAGKGELVRVGEPVFDLKPDSFFAEINPNFIAKAGLNEAAANILATTGKLQTNEVVTVSFEFDFRPFVSGSINVENNSQAFGTASSVQASDTSHDSSDVYEEGETPTLITLDSTGTIYDAISLSPISGAKVYLVGSSGQHLPDTCVATGQQGQITDVSGSYRFDINVGATTNCPTSSSAYSFKIVPPSDYLDKSIIRPVSSNMFDTASCNQQPQANYCEIGATYSVANLNAAYEYHLRFRYAENQPFLSNNHIPLDPKSTLDEMSLVKTTSSTSAAIGDIVSFELLISNDGQYPTSNFNVVDNLPSSLAYVPNTAVLSVDIDDGSQQTLRLEPSENSSGLVWKIQSSLQTPFNSIPANKSVKITYVTRIVTNSSNGIIQNSAQLQDTNGNALSRVSQARVTLASEPVFQCSALIGRVFDDKNGNGKMDHPDERGFNPKTTQTELGIPGAKLFTVNGEWITTDKFGRYSIPCAALPDDRIGENITLKLHTESLPAGYGPIDENPKTTRLSAGLMSVLNFPVQKYVSGNTSVDPRNVSGAIPQTATEFEKEWFMPLEVTTEQLSDQEIFGEAIPVGRPVYLGMFDITAQEAVLRHLEAGVKEGVVVEGRLAGYFKGRIKGNVLITLMADTGTGDIKGLFSDFTDQRKDAYRKMIDPARYYPVFGDSSSIVNGAPTTGKFYVRIERNSNYGVWGSVRAELKDSAFVRENSVIYGGRLHLQTEAEELTEDELAYRHKTCIAYGDSTIYGEPRVVFDAYGAKPDTHKSYVRFRANGGSNFYLRHSDVLPGTEVVEVQLIDPVTGLISSTKALSMNQDYTMDYRRGRLSLNKALPTSYLASDIFDLDGSENDQVFIVVNYSHTDVKVSDSGLNIGARGSAWLYNQLGVGVSAKRKTANGSSFKIASVDATLRHTQDTYIKAEVAASKGDQSTQYLSEDSGFNWVKSVSVGDGTKVSTAQNIEANISLGDFIKKEGFVNLNYQHKSKGFIDDSGVKDADIHAFQFVAEVKTNETDSVKLAADHVVINSPSVSPSSNVKLSYKWVPSTKTTYEIGAKISRSNRETSYAFAAAMQHAISERLALRANTTANLSDKGKLGDVALGLGADYKLNDKLALTVDALVRSRNPNTLRVGAKYVGLNNDEYTLSYQFGDGSDGSHMLKDGKLILNGKRRLKDNLAMTAAATSYLQDGKVTGVTTSTGLVYNPTDALELDFLAEYGEISDIEKFALSTGFKKKASTYSFNGKFEYSFDRDHAQQTRRDNYGVKLEQQIHGRDWHSTASLEALLSRNNGSSLDLGKFARASLGTAYRPENKDDLAALMMYTFLYDLPPEVQLNASQLSQIAHLFSVEASYRISERLRIGAKAGLKLGKQTTNRTSQDWSKTLVQLGILKGDLKLTERLNATLEGRLMSVSDQKELKTAVVGSLYYRFGNNTKFGVGYNYGGVTSNLEDHTRNERGWFLNLVSSF
ncbi:MAG: prealbumin-like fold domain-containing protein [Alphaproteobacteria bacterium]